MAIGSYLSAIRNFTVDTTSTVYNFSKDTLVKGFSACSSLAARVTQIVGKAIPNAVSNTVKANPKTFSFVAGVVVSGAISAIAYNILSNNKKATAKEQVVTLLNTIKDSIVKADSANAVTLIDSELSKHAS